MKREGSSLGILHRIYVVLLTWGKPVSEDRIGFLFETQVPKRQAALVWQQLVKPSLKEK